MWVQRHCPPGPLQSSRQGLGLEIGLFNQHSRHAYPLCSLRSLIRYPVGKFLVFYPSLHMKRFLFFCSNNYNRNTRLL